MTSGSSRGFVLFLGLVGTMLFSYMYVSLQTENITCSTGLQQNENRIQRKGEKLEQIQEEVEESEVSQEDPGESKEVSQEDREESKQSEDSRRIREVCQQYEGTEYILNASAVTYYHFEVDNKHKLLYCFVPKTGSSLWKAIYGILIGQINATNASTIDPYTVHFKVKFDQLHAYKKPQQDEILNSYFKFIVVRHPFERIVSGYTNKLNPGEPWFRKSIGSAIIKKYRQNPTDAELAEGTPTFREFVDYLTDPETPYKMDAHFLHFYRLCHPCHVNYDYIIRFENLKEDTENVLKMRNLTDLVTFTYNPPVTTNERLKKYFRQLTLHQIRNLYEEYRFDFELFGYEFNISDYL